MPLVNSLTSGVRTLGHRDFWTFKVVHALIGALLTLVGAAGGIFVTERIKTTMIRLDNQIAETTRRVEAIERALFQFQLIQTNGLMLSALSANEGLRGEFRSSFIALSFVMRQSPTARVMQELHYNNAAAFMRARDEYQELIEAAKPGNDKTAWDAVLQFEIEQESRLSTVQQQLYNLRFALQSRRRLLEDWLSTSIIGGFVLQQLGFFVVLLAGLVHQHTSSSELRPAGADPRHDAGSG
jgi:hypothetical protein